MGRAQQWLPVLLAAGTLLLWQQPLAVEGACCTLGQPTYQGSSLTKSSYGTEIAIATCSDGPCSGEGFNYLGTTGFESTNPSACCDPNDQAGQKFWYNPQAGSGETWWTNETMFGGPFPGTGRMCDPLLLKWQCAVGGQNVASCSDTDVATAGAQPFVCPAGMQLDPNSISSTPSTETCCVGSATSPSPSPTDPLDIPGAPTCGDIHPNVAGNQPFNCGALGDYVNNYMVHDVNVSNAGPPTASLCCRPRLSCIDVSPAEPGCQPHYCDTDDGWYPNQQAYFLPNPSNEVCCKRATCADKDVFKRGMQPQRCPTGTTYDPSKANFSPPSRRACCNGVATCGDTEPATPGSQTFYCDPSQGWAQNPNAASFPNPSSNICCVNMTRPTCGDFDPNTDGVQPWPCPLYAAANPTASSVYPPSNSACCVRTCADTDVSTAAPEPYSCPAGERLNLENSLLFPPSNSMCCTAIPPPPPPPSSPEPPTPSPTMPSPSPQIMSSCLDIDVETPGTQPFVCPADKQLNTTSTSTVPSIETCCMARENISPAPPLSPSPHPPLNPSPQPPVSPSPQPPPGHPTCGDTQPDVAGNQPFDCAALGDYVNNEMVLGVNVSSAGPPTATLCCRPRLSCIDVDPEQPECQPFYCDTEEGYYPDQTAYYLPNPSPEVCCKRATCADKDPFKRGMQQQRCPVGTTYDPSKANFSPPSRADCCKGVPTCGDTEPSTPGSQTFYCNPSQGWAQNPNAAPYPNPSSEICCVPIGRSTCGDLDPITPGVQPWPCPPYAAANPTASSVYPPSNTACCMRTCADTNVNTYVAERYSCATGETYIEDNALVSPPSNSACCTMIPPPLPSPSPAMSPEVSSPPPASPSPAPTQVQLALLSQYPAGYSGPTANLYAQGPSSCTKQPSTRLEGSVTVQQPGAGACGSGVTPGMYVLTQVAAPGTTFDHWEVYNATTGALISTSTNPSITVPVDGSVTVVAVYTVDVPNPSPAVPSPSPATTSPAPPVSPVVPSPPPATPSPAPPVSPVPSPGPGATCGDADIDTPGMQPFQCPYGTVTNPNTPYASPPSTIRCCLATCSDKNVERDGRQPWTCSSGSIVNTANALKSPPTHADCCLPTCADKNVLRRGNQMWTCPPGSVYNSANAGSSPPSNDVCCSQQAPIVSPSPPPTVPSPSPAASQVQLALLSQYPAGYSGPTANLYAQGPGSCTKEPSTRLEGSVTVQQPGAGMCGSGVTPGMYTLTQVAVPGTTFDHWEVYNATTGALISSSANPSITVPVDGSVTAVAVYTVNVPPLPSPVPSPPPTVPSPSPSPAPNNPTCSQPAYPCPSNTLVNTMNAAYSPPSNEACCLPTCSDKNVAKPGAQPWKCGPGTLVNAAHAMSGPPDNEVCCLPTCTDVNVETNKKNESYVCMPGSTFNSAHAMYTPPSQDVCCMPLPAPSPSPAAPTLVQLALLSQFPAGYSGPTANLYATGPGSCTKEPSTRLEGSVTVQQPGAGVCGSGVPPGMYTLTQVAPPGTTFERWNVYNATTGALISTSINPSITVPVDGSVTVVAVYTVNIPPLPSPVPSPPPAVPSPSPAPMNPTCSQPAYPCPSGTLANAMNAAYSPPSNGACCLPTCTDVNVNTNGAENYVCMPGTLPNSARAMFTPPSQNACCVPVPAPSPSPSPPPSNPTCSQPAYPCPSGTLVNFMNAAYSPPSNSACCLPTCTDVNVNTNGAENYVCMPGSLPNSAHAMFTPPSQNTCCVPFPAPSPSPAVPSPSPASPSCGDVSPQVAGDQQFDCSVLGDYVFNSNMSSASPPSARTCCMPKVSCIDINPDVEGCQPWICDEDQGWYVNQHATYRPNPSSEVCCLRATCGDTDVYKAGSQPQMCGRNMQLDSAKLNSSPPTKSLCCKPR